MQPPTITMRALNDEAIRKIEIRLAAGRTVWQIHKELNISRPAIYRVQLNLEYFGQPRTPVTVKQGRP